MCRNSHAPRLLIPSHSDKPYTNLHIICFASSYSWMYKLSTVRAMNQSFVADSLHLFLQKGHSYHVIFSGTISHCWLKSHKMSPRTSATSPKRTRYMSLISVKPTKSTFSCHTSVVNVEKGSWLAASFRPTVTRFQCPGFQFRKTSTHITLQTVYF